MSYVKRLLTDEDRAYLRDHPPELSIGGDIPYCDFCGERPFYMYQADRMSTGERRECWRWCACQTCSAAVDMNRWNVIESRVAAWLGIRMRIPAFAVEMAVDKCKSDFLRDASRGPTEGQHRTQSLRRA